MDIKKFKTIFLILITILAVLEIMLFVKVLFSDAKGFEWGSVTDWVSALCNVAMASAAAYAALQAKKWFLQHSYSTAFNKAAEFLSKVDDKKSTINDLYLDLQSLMNYAGNGKQITDIKHYHERIEFYNNQAFKITKLKDEYRTLKRWHIKVSNEELINDILTNLWKLYSQAAATFSFGQSAYADTEHQCDGELPFMQYDLRISFENVQLIIHELNESYNDYVDKDFFYFFNAK